MQKKKKRGNRNSIRDEWKENAREEESEGESMCVWCKGKLLKKYGYKVSNCDRSFIIYT